MAPPALLLLVLTCLAACARRPVAVEAPAGDERDTSAPALANDLEFQAVEEEGASGPADNDGRYLASQLESPEATTASIVPRVTTNDAKAAAVGLDVEVVLRLVRARINRLRYCYAQALKGNPQVTGTVTLTWSLDETGYARSPRLVQSTLDDDELHACLLATIDGDRFPRPNEKPASATVEFKFAPE